MTTTYSFSSRLYIDGRRTDGRSDTPVPVRNPATEETVAVVAGSSPQTYGLPSRRPGAPSTRAPGHG